MGTVSKALGLLEFLKDPDAILGLTEISRLAGFDKATTRRLLLELAANGFVEQDISSRAYLLGPTLQMLGHAREKRFPLFRTVQPFVRDLAEQTGETVHAAEYCAGVLVSICNEQSQKANRVILEHGQKLPLHATASGMAFLAASSSAFAESVFRKPMQVFTPNTVNDPGTLLSVMRETRKRGYSISDQSMEDGVHSVAAAIVSNSGKPVGTVAVAMPTSRVSPSAIELFGKLVRQTAEDISVKLFGRSAAPLRKAS